MCGGIKVSPATSILAKGLSPRVRRHPKIQEEANQNERSISAGAEASASLQPPTASCRVYLRGCGGIVLLAHVRRRHRGLSPRVRRHPMARGCKSHRHGSISAGAEASGIYVDHGDVGEVYLRGCGGILTMKQEGIYHQGLSPRVRRHHSPDTSCSPRTGSISAGAEASQTAVPLSVWFRVYLRGCGGIRHLTPKISATPGLSPRVRRHPCVIVTQRIHVLA